MKQGGSLQTVLGQVAAIERSKKDFIAPQGLLAMLPEGQGVVLRAGAGEFMQIRPRAHQQIAQELHIPGEYYQRMLEEAPALLAKNVMEWLNRAPSQKRLLRTLGAGASVALAGSEGQGAAPAPALALRAYLSDRYRPLDNYDLAEAVLPILDNGKEGLVIESVGITEDRFYLKAVSERVQGEVKVGDRVQAGIVISNSEVGAGSLRVEPLIYRLACLNGMVRNDARVRKYHVGKRALTDDSAAVAFFSDETRRADDKAFFLKVKDTVRAAFDQAFFDEGVRQLRAAAGEKIDLSAEATIETLKDYLREEERGRVLEAYILGDDKTVYGVANAVTRASQDVESYDRATELERLGGLIVAGDVKLN